MAHLPVRENLRSMSRSDIQKLCKDNNIKANMRTDEMINALCDLVNGKDVPRPHRVMSERASHPPPTSRLNSVPSASKPTETSAKKIALQPSESNTDAESTADTPVSAPTTRHKAKELQLHLGKGRPVIAGGSGARSITISRGAGRKAKASTMLQEDPIAEEEETVGSMQVPTDLQVENFSINEAIHESSAHPPFPTIDPTCATNLDQPSNLPAPAPPNVSWSWSHAQLAAVESRVAQLETLNLTARVAEVEATLNDIPVLKASLAQIPALRDEIKDLEAGQRSLKAEVTQWVMSHSELTARIVSLEGHIKGLVIENEMLKNRVMELDTGLHGLENAAEGPSMSSVIIHSPRAMDRAGNNVENDMEKGKGVNKGKGLEKEETVGTTSAKPIVFSLRSDLPNPSPSLPTLGKRARSPTETPDVSLSEITVDATPKQRRDAEVAGIHRIIKPQRKKPRLAIDPHEDVPPFSFFDGCAGPSSTSTPHPRRSGSPPGFFTVGHRPLTPLVRPDDEDFMSLDIDESMQGLDTTKSNGIVGADGCAMGPAGAASLSKRTTAAPSTDAENPSGTADPLHDPSFFSGPLPVYYAQDSQLPFPLRPATPLNPQDILERSAQLATPILGEPWKFDPTVNPANIARLGDGMRQADTPGSVRSFASSSNAVAPESPGDYTLRAGGRKERNDKYNPYFTPQRGPGARHRTGITPTSAFSFSLKSPVKMTTVAEAPEAETEDGVVRSPPGLRTLYGTELAGDSRFGDYGRDIGRYDWDKYAPR